jgi:hypothetical protein
MKIQYSEEGGIAYFPGLAKPKTIDLSELSGEASEQLRQLISRVDFWNLPAAVGSVSKGGADFRTYIITIEEKDRSHTVKIIEPVANAEFKGLLETIQKMVKNPRKQP